MATVNVEDLVTRIATQCLAFMKTEAAPPPKAKGDSMAKARDALAKKRAAAAAAVAEPVKAKAKKASTPKAKAAPAKTRRLKAGTEVEANGLRLVVQEATKRRGRVYAALMLGDTFCGSVRIDDAAIRRKVAKAIGGDVGAALELIGG